MNKWDLNFKILGYHKTNHIIYQIHVICNKKSELAFCEGFEEILHYGMMRCCSLSSLFVKVSKKSFTMG